ncbi:MAG: hypothetical protein IK095_08140, partial [Oscillospiraceae bacterium]|nr:hypothetical protein [Oscillospiraceae bacterium]
EDDDEDERPRRGSRGRHRAGDEEEPDVILEADFRSRRRYANAAIKMIQRFLRSQSIYAQPREIRPGVNVFTFERRFNGEDVDVHILIEESILNMRIEYILPFTIRRGRGPFIDYMMMAKDFPLRYGKIIRDHNDDEQKLEHSFNFMGAFSYQGFARYWDALHSTMRVYFAEMQQYTTQKLTKEQRKTIRTMIRDLESALPKKKVDPNAIG